LLALRTCKKAFHAGGVSLRVGMVVESAEIKNTHHLATCIGYGASAVCPYFALEMVYFEQDKELKSLSPEQMERNIIKTFEAGLLKIMSKMGISVVRSYENSQLFTTIGLDFDLANTYFVRSTHYLSGIGLPQIVDNIIEKSNFAQKQAEKKELWNTYIFKEHARGLQGEKHSMTASISKIIHQLARDKNYDLTNPDLYQSYLESNSSQNPIHIRHLFSLKTSKNKHKNTEIQSLEAILATFGAGAMSFGAISAEAQRDILKAMQIIGGRSNSGEGGENPYYYSEGISATIKQVASGRFGVDALYLISSNEYQIKVAQGAKPGEGGQLMAVKVDAQIAKARHSLTHVDLISPPPLHDIYSIEDLKELIYQLKQINPYAKINVKLVAGAGIGTIAVGVAKAGADIIHISGSDGGTGAATLSSMKHAGIPWEFGLWEAHKALIDNKIRQNVMLRTDGGLHTGKDIIIAAILGADNFEFGKLLLIAQGCIMARICEKNTCPTGIATHNEKFKAKYQGNEWHIVKILKYLAKDIQTKLAFLGINTLEELKGRTDLLEIDTAHQNLIQNKNIRLDFILKEFGYYLPKNNDLTIKNRENKNIFDEKLAQLNKKILQDTQKALEENKNIVLDYPIKNTDRAILATLAGKIAWKEHQKIIQKNTTLPTFTQKIEITFKGSAGQGFGAFMTKGMHIKLEGEANDSVAKSMSGGKMLIIPPKNTYFKAHENVIIGNCALYGAINGTLYVNGKAGDRFAVRNSGALAVVEGVGLHACEYMTRGKVIILGKTSYNVGSGMTGGELFLYQPNPATINQEYITEIEIDESILEDLKNILLDYYHETRSILCDEILKNWEVEKELFKKYVPLKYLENIANQSSILVETSKKI
ncbi:MAG: glutamate synthase large subunit, partial [Cytophagia bacterium]